MRRRRLLSALAGGAALLAGCNGFGGSDRPATTFAPPEETPTPPPETVTVDSVVTDLGRYVRSVSEFGDPRTVQLFVPAYRNGGLQVVAEFVRDATAGHPATLRVTASNVSGSTISVPMGASPPLSSHVARTGGGAPAVLFVPANTINDEPVRPDGPTDGLWRAASMPTEETGEQSEFELDPGEQVERTYLVLAPPEATELPVGEFTLRETNYGWKPRVAVWNHLRPGRTEDSQFEADSLPPLPRTTATRWYHETGPRTEVYLDPTSETADLPEARLRLGLRNYTDQRTGYDRDDFGLYRFEDGEWWDLAPPGGFDDGPQTTVFPGGTGEIGFQVANRDRVTFDRSASTIARQWLGGGTYAISVTTRYDGTRDREPVTHAAALRLRGDALGVTPSPFVTSRRREGDRVVLTHEEYADDVGDNRGRLTVAPAPEATDSDRLITEQVMGSTGLRDTVAALEETDAERTLLRTSWRTAAAALAVAGADGDRSTTFVYDGRTYAASAERA